MNQSAGPPNMRPNYVCRQETEPRARQQVQLKEHTSTAARRTVEIKAWVGAAFGVVPSEEKSLLQVQNDP